MSPLKFIILLLSLTPSIRSVNIFDKDILRSWDFGKFTLVFDVGQKCDFENETAQLFESGMSILLHKDPHSIHRIPTGSVYQFVVLVTDNDNIAKVTALTILKIFILKTKSFPSVHRPSRSAFKSPRSFRTQQSF